MQCVSRLRLLAELTTSGHSTQDGALSAPFATSVPDIASRARTSAHSTACYHDVRPRASHGVRERRGVVACDDVAAEGAVDGILGYTSNDKYLYLQFYVVDPVHDGLGGVRESQVKCCKGFNPSSRR
eukprot:1251949-Rhodomonas_salina.1